MKTVGSLASIASDIAIILCIVGLCNLIGSNPCPTSSHRSLTVKNGVDWETLVGTLRVHTHKITQNTPPSHSQCAPAAKRHPPLGASGGQGPAAGRWRWPAPAERRRGNFAFRAISGAISTSISTAAAVVQFIDSAVAAAAAAAGGWVRQRVWWPVGRRGRRGDADSCP